MSAPRQVYAKLPPDDEFPELLAMHGTYGRLAAVLGCSETAVSYRCKKLGLASPGRRGGRRLCCRCGAPSEERPILRFVLATYVRASATRQTRGAGSIFMCEPCWLTATRAALLLPRRLRAVA